VPSHGLVSICAMVGRARDAETSDNEFWGSDRRRLRTPVSGSYLVDALVVLVALLVFATIAGVVALWPHGQLGRSAQFGPIHTVGAVAESVESVPCALSASHTCHVAHIKILDGPQKGRTTVLTTVAAVGSLDVSKGDGSGSTRMPCHPGRDTSRRSRSRISTAEAPCSGSVSASLSCC
jgi:hypothetical protein